MLVILEAPTVVSVSVARGPTYGPNIWALESQVSGYLESGQLGDVGWCMATDNGIT